MCGGVFLTAFLAFLSRSARRVCKNFGMSAVGRPNCRPRFFFCGGRGFIHGLFFQGREYDVQRM